MSDTTAKTVNDAAFEILSATVKEGSKVRVILRIPKGMHGSRISWVDSMDGNVGVGIHTVTDVSPRYGAFELDNEKWYPAVALSADAETVRVALPDYEAEITKDGIVVAGQNLTKEMVLGIVQGALDTGFLDKGDVATIKTS